MTIKFRSKFEASIAKKLKDSGADFRYEPEKLKFIEPAKTRSYLPDLILGNGIVVEIKGRLTAADRKKMVLVRDQHPGRDIRIIFQRAANPINKGSKTSYADWAEAAGFKWAEGSVPQAWIDEPGR
ncbi:hypothetical protein JL100_018050 [Skermanella mucosa]|uniref:hypothetical protein n=1 Tax=Skermanella mucosa TaxID=1789672 RepID=UPI00192CC7A6|nr:hypothetical protein [Skermanella mucosa]UEM18989.1 hypothetical protein JL100_018050 [Skermanella mucosa]